MELSAEPREALRIGRQVRAVRKTIKNYDAPESLKVIGDAATITTNDVAVNDVMVRGWLNEELRIATHVLYVSKGKARDDLQRKPHF